MDRPVGSVTYTPFLDERGGMVADVTVTRLADDRFRVVTGAGFVASDLAWLRTPRGRGDVVGVAPRRERRDRDDRAVGPAGARHPRRDDTDDVGDAALPARRAVEVDVAGRRSSRRASATPASSAGS